MTGETVPDEQLARAVQQGDKNAFVELYRRYQPKILGYGRRFLYRYEDIEDAAQEVFIKAYSNLQGYNANRKFSSWIYRVAHNTFIDIIRKKGREPLSILDFDTFINLPVREKMSTEEKIAFKMDLAKAEERIARLPAKYREVFVLYYYEEKNYQEIAEILHIPTSTIGVRLLRARTLLKKETKPV